MTDRRASVRQRAFLKGVAWFNNRAASVDCTIRDISEGGAKLVLASDVLVPNAIELDIPSKDQTILAQACWRSGREMGVCFLRDGAQDAAPKGDLESRVAHLEGEVEKLRRALGRMRTDLLRSIGDRDLTTE